MLHIMTASNKNSQNIFCSYQKLLQLKAITHKLYPYVHVHDHKYVVMNKIYEEGGRSLLYIYHVYICIINESCIIICCLTSFVLTSHDISTWDTS